jgi:hypothetical protein
MDFKKPFRENFHEIPRKNVVLTKIFFREKFLFFFPRKFLRENFCAKFFTKIIFAKYDEKYSAKNLFS